MTNDEIRSFIENAIKENKVMLFMKGTPQQPACGFSMRASGVLNEPASSTRRSTSFPTREFASCRPFRAGRRFRSCS